MPDIHVRVTMFNPEEDAVKRIRWDPIVTSSIRRANQILQPFGFRVRVSNRYDLDIPGSRRLLTRNLLEEEERVVPPGSPIAHQRYRESLRLARLSGHAYNLNAASIVAEHVGQGRVSVEAKAILNLNRAPGEVATYWVPDIDNPISTGHTVCQPYYANIAANREGIFLSADITPTTLVHEIGHLLMRTGHCEQPISHASRPACRCARANNLMHGNGSASSRTRLTDEQVTRMETEGRRSHYFH